MTTGFDKNRKAVNGAAVGETGAGGTSTGRTPRHAANGGREGWDKCPNCDELKATEVTGTKLPGKPPVYFCSKCGRKLTGDETRHIFCRYNNLHTEETNHAS